MRYILLGSLLLLVGCFSKEQPQKQVVKIEDNAEMCSFIDNKTRVKLVLLIKKMALNEQFQIFAKDIIKYAQRHYILDLRANQVVNRYINTSTMKKHLAFIDGIAAETLSKKEREDLYRSMAEILSITGYTTPGDDQELFRLEVVHNLMCYSLGILEVLSKYENNINSEEQRKLIAENKKIYKQDPIVKIDMDALFGVPVGEPIDYPAYYAGETNDKQKSAKKKLSPRQNKARHFTLINPKEKANDPSETQTQTATPTNPQGSEDPSAVSAAIKDVTDPAKAQVQQKVKEVITNEVQEVLEKIE